MGAGDNGEPIGDGLDEVMSGFGEPAEPKDVGEFQAAEPEDSTDYTGTQLTVTWGKEHLQPCRFQGMDVGPYAMQVVIEEGETPLAAYRRAMLHMNAMAEEELARKLPKFIQRVKDAAEFA